MRGHTAVGSFEWIAVVVRHMVERAVSPETVRCRTLVGVGIMVKPILAGEAASEGERCLLDGFRVGCRGTGLTRGGSGSGCGGDFKTRRQLNRCSKRGPGVTHDTVCSEMSDG